MVADAMSALAEKSAFIAFVHASVSSGVWVLLLVGVGVPEQELAATELGRCCGAAGAGRYNLLFCCWELVDPMGGCRRGGTSTKNTAGGLIGSGRAKSAATGKGGEGGECFVRLRP